MFRGFGTSTTELDEDDVKSIIANDDMYTSWVDYILIGDEPLDTNGRLFPNTLNINHFAPTQFDNLKKFLSFMPRMMLWEWFNENVRKTLTGTLNYWNPAIGGKVKPIQTALYGTVFTPGPYDIMMWAAFVNLFNMANFDYVTRHFLEPEQWEQEKLEAYYIAQSQASVADISATIDSFKQLDLAADPKARALLERYVKLPKIGDPGLEITRQNAVRELLRNQEYEAVDAIIKAYEYAATTPVGADIVRKLPVDVVSGDGRIVKATQL